MKKILLMVLVLTAVLLVPGCGLYNSQLNLPSYIEKIAIPVFANSTAEYEIPQYLTQQTINEFMGNGKLQITDETSADAVLKGEVTNYLNTPIDFDANQVPRQYRIIIHMTLYFFDNQAQKIIWTDKKVWEETTYYVPNNIGMPAEDQNSARKRVLDQLAKSILNRVLFGWTK